MMFLWSSLIGKQGGRERFAEQMANTLPRPLRL